MLQRDARPVTLSWQLGLSISLPYAVHMTQIDQKPWGKAAPAGLFATCLKRARASDSKIWARVASWFARDAIDIETLGFKARLHPRDNLSEKRILYTPGRFDPTELEFLSGLLHPGFTFVDLGANCGTYTLHLAVKSSGRANFYAIEAQPEMARRFAFNLAANKISAFVQLDELAISDERGDVTFTINRHNRGESGLEGAGDTITVPALPLSDYLADRNIKQIDAMKIDVEGLEHQILQPFFATASPDLWPRCLIVEQLFATPAKDPVALACANGYRIERDLGRNVILVLEMSQ
ncbi:MAG: methyltransferase [Hyphobacterium sp.]|nr:MAG: methyltransferase [Hyphobacterium sp.]